ncbi:MAG: hypothetical protein VB934_10410 [Polyangiaceae bacterium]
MSQPSSPDDERYESLAVKAVDGQLSAEERAELDALLAQSSERAAELEDFLSIKETTDAMTQRILTTARIEPPRVGRGARWIQRSSFLALLFGALLLCGYGAYHLFVDPELPPVVKLATLVGMSGLFALFSYALTVRLRAAGKDPYQEIDR